MKRLKNILLYKYNTVLLSDVGQFQNKNRKLDLNVPI